MNENIRLFNGDCLEVMDKLIEQGVKVDAIITDPPYKLTSGGHANTKIKGCIGRIENEHAKTGNIFSHNKITFKDWFGKAYQLLKDGTHFYCMCNDKNLQGVLNAGEEAGFKEVNVLVWEKGMHTPTQYYMKNVEFIVLFRKGKAKYINNMGSFALIKIHGVRGNKIHPSEKPVELMKHLIENSTNENDLILDPFIGSGSTGVACINTNRKFIGIELDEKYFNIASDRIHKALSEKENI